MNLLGETAIGVGIGVALLALALYFGRSIRIEDIVSAGRKPEAKADGGYAHGFPSGYGKPTGVIRWLTTVDHKDIGLLYLTFGSIAFFWGGTDAMMIRTELFTHSVDVWDTATYNGLFTMHGLTMLFFFATPVLFGFINYFLPLLIGADDMAFPRVNAVAFWMLPAAFVLVRFGLLSDIIGHVIQPVLGMAAASPFFRLEPPQTGWTMYTPLARQRPNPMINIMLLGLHLSGISTTLGAINIIVTTFTLRDVDWSELDIFTWTALTQAGLILFAFPLLGSAIIMLLLDRVFGTTFFATGGGGPMLWQNLFWFFGHPEVYILVLPPMGLISLIIPKFSGRKLFGFKFVVYSTLAIGVLSFGVWAHHMFATGMDPRLRASFMAVSLAIAVPSAVKTFNWISTMWNGAIRLEAPMLFCVGSIATFIIGGVTGVFLAAIPVDLILHDTYYVVGHFHLIIMGLIPFGMFAAVYYWFPIFTGRMYDRTLAKVHFWLTFVGVMITFNAFIVLGMMGLPRRYASYPVKFQLLQQIASFGAVLIALGSLVWIWNMLQSYRNGDIVTDADVWNLKKYGMFSKEWQWFEEQLESR
ncbi:MULTISPECIES: cbb3-type cytochrome c oxidase subunit I [unclassified Haladaptatus]|uniref:cbb3-type cytochrome c oxidase subunit I n=1 Tax=unclassified Haladaptatus TaxID=2622732 RepID=UPI00209C147E|nr:MULTISPECIES: cbb3-type cytochrome c oxidase subunit I [unclassified Haladaptatus]MCO8245770.1 cbb3-type cytochrome c oxidase subunit I [Haladaptatus sp. AB643]MCO8256116.1 cbb3-type cytochrome c oxidase subunit I [Haladaptatus sp. AB618]